MNPRNKISIVSRGYPLFALRWRYNAQPIIVSGMLSGGKKLIGMWKKCKVKRNFIYQPILFRSRKTFINFLGCLMVYLMSRCGMAFIRSVKVRFYVPFEEQWRVWRTFQWACIWVCTCKHITTFWWLCFSTLII
jgi:hypothetical protein